MPSADTPLLCIHCEQPTEAVNWQGLCPRCAGVKGIVILYRKVATISPAQEAHLRRLRDRANRRLPLFTRKANTMLERQLDDPIEERKRDRAHDATDSKDTGDFNLARCPLCHGILTPCYTKQGPTFVCQCQE